MTEKKGHFEKGVWVAEPVAPATPATPATAKDENPIDARLAAASRSVISAMDDLAKATHDLVATEEGKKHIEKTVKETTDEIEKSFNAIISKVKAEVEKAAKPKK